MPSDVVLSVRHLGFPWETFDPFLFCVHHDDRYPAGTEDMGPPRAALSGRNIGMDFEIRDGWRMYHGDVIPGFPRHPHRGFETITIARNGFIDHSDSLGATARFGHGDVQWMTAGKGVVHAEMFPLVHRDQGNPTELFQIWLNLPRADKMVDPYFTMLWNETIPKGTVRDLQGRATEVRVIAGALGDAIAPPPPPNSWASKEEAGILILSLKLTPNASFQLPPGPADANRALYLFRGSSLRVAGAKTPASVCVRVRPDTPVTIENGPDEAEVLVLQGRPIGEPVAHHGPFVMNTRAELQQAFVDYQRTRFGGWPWDVDGPVHPRTRGRFAVHAGGRVEEPKV